MKIKNYKYKKIDNKLFFIYKRYFFFWWEVDSIAFSEETAKLAVNQLNNEI